MRNSITAFETDFNHQFRIFGPKLCQIWVIRCVFANSAPNFDDFSDIAPLTVK